MIFNDIAIKSNTETKEKLYMKTTLFFDLCKCAKKHQWFEKENRATPLLAITIETRTAVRVFLLTNFAIMV